MAHPQYASPPHQMAPRTFGFRNSIWFLQIAMPAVMLVVAVVGVLNFLSGRSDSDTGWGFQYFYLLGAAGVFVYFGFFRGYAVEISEGTLTWRAPYRKRSVSIADVTGSKFAWWDIAKRQPTLLIRNQRPMPVEARGYGWPKFVARFNQELGAPVLNDPRLNNPRYFRESSSWLGGYFER